MSSSGLVQADDDDGVEAVLSWSPYILGQRPA